MIFILFHFSFLETLFRVYWVFDAVIYVSLIIFISLASSSEARIPQVCFLTNWFASCSIQFAVASIDSIKVSSHTFQLKTYFPFFTLFSVYDYRYCFYTLKVRCLCRGVSSQIGTLGGDLSFLSQRHFARFTLWVPSWLPHHMKTPSFTALPENSSKLKFAPTHPPRT